MLPLTEREKTPKLYTVSFSSVIKILSWFLIGFFGGVYEKNKGSSGQEKAVIKSTASEVFLLGFRYWPMQFSSQVVLHKLLHLSVPLHSHL